MRDRTAFKLNQTTQHWRERINRRGRRVSQKLFRIVIPLRASAPSAVESPNFSWFDLATLVLGIFCLSTFAGPTHGTSQSSPTVRQRIEATTRKLTSPEFNGRA